MKAEREQLQAQMALLRVEGDNHAVVSGTAVDIFCPRYCRTLWMHAPCTHSLLPPLPIMLLDALRKVGPYKVILYLMFRLVSMCSRICSGFISTFLKSIKPGIA